MLVIIYMRMDFAISKVRFIRCCSNTGVFPTRSDPRFASIFPSGLVFNLHFALSGVIAKNGMLLVDIFISWYCALLYFTHWVLSMIALFRMKQTSLACELPALPKKPSVCWIAKVAFILCTQTPFLSLSPAKMPLHLRMHARSWMEIIAPSVIRFLRWWLLSARSSPGFLKRWG